MLVSSVISNFLVLNDYGKSCFCNFKRTELLNDSIVARINSAPNNAARIVAASDFCLGSCCGNGDLSIICRNQAGDGCLVLRQCRAVISPGSRAGGDCHLGRQDLQAAGTYVEAYAVVAVGVRKIC